MTARRTRRVENTPPKLPEGVSLAEWSLERVRSQNPRIRCMLGCLRLLDEVAESNFAILHCSPRRLMEIWHTLVEVSSTLRAELAPLVQGRRSVIPALDAAVRGTAARLAALETTVLAELDREPAQPSLDRLEQLRPTICVAMGKAQSLLLDSLGEILAADPRSREDTDYYLSRRFARDVDDTEWLHTSVWRLENYLVRLNRFRPSSLTAVADHIESAGTVPSQELWQSTRLFLEEILGNLGPKLQRIVGLRGIRIDELEVVESSAAEVSRRCHVILVLHDAALAALDALTGAAGAGADAARQLVGEAIGRGLVVAMRELDDRLRDLSAFVPLWRSNLAQRRALAFRHEDAAPPDPRPSG